MDNNENLLLDTLTLLQTINGYDEVSKLPKSSFAYQQYIEEDVSHPELIRTMAVDKLGIYIILDKYNEDFVKIRITSKSPSEPEFRVLWSNLLRHIKALSNPENFDKTPIFYMAIVSNQTVALEEGDGVANIQAINPFSINSYSSKNDKYNDVIELIYLKDNVTYEFNDDKNYNLKVIKEELMQEIEQEKIEDFNKLLEKDNFKDDN